MLKIDLRPGEAIRVGDAIVTLESKLGQVARLSVQADKSIPISRVKDASAFSNMVAERGIAAKA